jgi:Skp family chaperone for outer membrane proteins
VKFPTQLFAALLVLAALTLGAMPAPAQEAAGGYKIGVVDFRKVMENYSKREAEYKKLQDEVDALQIGIDEKFKRIEGLRDAYEANVGTWDQATRSSKEEEINTLYDEYRAELAQRQRKIDRMEREVVQKLFESVRTVVAKIGETEGYHLILEANSPNPPRGGVLYHSTTIDITPKVLAALD